MLALRKRKVKAEYSVFSKADPKTKRKRKVSGNFETECFDLTFFLIAMGIFTCVVVEF